MVDIEELVRKLGDPCAETRKSLAGALGRTANQGANITVAIPALAKALSDEVSDVRSYAAWALGNSALQGVDITVAIPVLVKTLSDVAGDVQWNAAEALEKAIKKCASVEALNVMEAKLRESYGALRRECRYGKKAELAGIGSVFSKLTNQIAKKRDSLAAKRDILLDEKPKPPKGGVYQQIRRSGTGLLRGF
jgi:hypothetical protein